MSVGTLHVCVVECRLVATNGEKAKDFYPYCNVNVGKETKKTPQVKESLTPVWNSRFTFNVNNPDTQLLIEIWNKGWIKDKFLGVVFTRLRNFRNGKPSEMWYKLKSLSDYQKIKKHLNTGLPLDALTLKEKPTEYTEVLKEEITRGQLLVKVLFVLNDNWLVPKKIWGHKRFHEGRNIGSAGRSGGCRRK